MLGIPDFWIWSAYLLCILSTAACIIYGLKNWNKGSNDETRQVEEEAAWEKAEKEVKANL
jgi:heme exporter protein D